MEWSDDAIVISVKPHGESAAILEALTKEHGRHLGLIHGGGSRKAKAALQPGNTLHVVWRARLNEHLGTFAIEPARMRAGELLEHRAALAGLNAFTSVVGAVLPEREPHGSIYDAGELLLSALPGHSIAEWGPLYVRWEAGLLEALGFGLDLSQCAATGSVRDLIYVSPRTGRAVSEGPGADYASRLLPLPQFLLGASPAPDLAATRAGLKLTGHFLLERVLAPHGREMPQARLRLDALAA